jgi:hypothetical protein
MTTDSAAVAWVQALQARGVRLKAHGKKGLAMIPKSAYGEMSNEERAALRAHKRDIVALVREGKYAPTVAEPQAAKTPPAPCEFCYQAPCIGEGHELFDLLHPLTREQTLTRRLARWEKDLHEMKMRKLFGLPSPTWGL